MNAADLLDDAFPHGTIDGYRAGCRGGACPGVIACRDVYQRYMGDYRFKRAIDAGTPVAEIVAADEAVRAGAAARDREAERAIRAEQARAAAAVRGQGLAHHRANIIRLHGEGKTDAEIGVEIGVSRGRVGDFRRELELPANRKPGKQRERAPRAPRRDAHPLVAALHAEGLRDAEIAERINLNAAYVGQLRRDLHLPPNRRPSANRAAPRPRRDLSPDVAKLHDQGLTDAQIGEKLNAGTAWVSELRRRMGRRVNRQPNTRPTGRTRRTDRREELAAAHAEGLTDRLIAERLGLSRSEVGRLRRELGLTANEGPRAPSTREILPCGTNASYARGCRCDACHKAQREYYREWARSKRAEGIPDEHHGTPYGYQLGCRGRKACPAETSCTDAMLAEERRRRREAGIPAAPTRVPAAPIRTHVRALMADGMSVLAIADTAQVSRSGLKTLLYGRSGDRKGHFPAEIEADKAQRLLALGRTTQ
jgi:DNA-binding NarL/FixJ family response regulator